MNYLRIVKKKFLFCIHWKEVFTKTDIGHIQDKMLLKIKAYLKKEKVCIVSRLSDAVATLDCLEWFCSCDYIQ